MGRASGEKNPKSISLSSDGSAASSKGCDLGPTYTRTVCLARSWVNGVRRPTSSVSPSKRRAMTASPAASMVHEDSGKIRVGQGSPGYLSLLYLSFPGLFGGLMEDFPTHIAARVLSCLPLPADIIHMTQQSRSPEQEHRTPRWRLQSL